MAKLPVTGLSRKLGIEPIAHELRKLREEREATDTAAQQNDVAVEAQDASIIDGTYLKLEENFDASLDVGTNQPVLRDRAAVQGGNESGTKNLDFVGMLSITLTADLTVTGINNFNGVSMLIYANLAGFSLLFDTAAFQGANGARLFSGSQKVLISITNPGGSEKLVVLAAQALS